MSSRIIDSIAVGGAIAWPDVVAALRHGHAGARPVIDELLTERDGRSVFTRSAWVPGLGIGVKTVSVFTENPNRPDPLPSVQGIFTVFDDETGAVLGIIDGPLITYYKTAADSLLAASYLMRRDAQQMLVIGSGQVARAALDGYSHMFPTLKRFRVWSRKAATAQALVAELEEDFAARGLEIASVRELEPAVAEAAVITTATSSADPVLFGRSVSPGTHVDLVGAYTLTMREADDELLRKGRLFVDCRDTTIAHIGEIAIPLASGAIRETDIVADFYDLNTRRYARADDNEITVFKNGGGAHLDLMTAKYLLAQYRSA